jgi:macrolide transport system ATP-binding/permease protein
MVLADASWLAGIGIAGGLVCSLAAARLLRGLLFGVRAWDLSTLAAVVTVLGIAALVASYVPARRAASVNPVDALRTE